MIYNFTIQVGTQTQLVTATPEDLRSKLIEKGAQNVNIFTSRFSKEEKVVNFLVGNTLITGRGVKA